MNILLRMPIYVKTQRVLLPGAFRTVRTTARLPVRATLSFAHLVTLATNLHE